MKKPKHSSFDIPRLRLANQHLTTQTVTDPVEVVHRLGAVQAQDYAGAKWGVGQRAKGLTDAVVERALDDGAIIRTHVLRPTWHMMAAQDARWILALTAPRVQIANTHPYKATGLDATTFRKAEKVISKALAGGNSLTRQELGAALARAGLEASPHPQWLAYVMMNAELTALICSGRRRGKQFTYALFDERVPLTKPLARDEALAELARRYFRTRGPATVHDFSWWSGLTVAEAKMGTQFLAGELLSEEMDGATYWFADTPWGSVATTNAAHLLPNYDEYFIGFKNRRAILDVIKEFSIVPGDPRFNAHVVALDGQLVGGWKRAIKPKAVTVDLQLLSKPPRGARKALVEAAQRLGIFLGLSAELSGHE